MFVFNLGNDFRNIYSKAQPLYTITLDSMKKYLDILTHSHTMTPFDAPGKPAF